MSDSREGMVKRGRLIECSRCGSHGIVGNSLDECPDCGGSGLNWEYPGGAIARYYSGPLLSGPSRRAIASAMKEKE